MANKKNNSVIAIYGIFFVLFNVFYLGIPFKKGGASWIVYFFTLISIVASLVITGYAFKNEEELTSKVYGFPVFRIGILYMGCQIALCIIISMVTLFVKVPAWIPTILSVLLLGLAAMGVIATDNTRDTIEEMEQQIVTKTRAITYFRLDTAGLVDRCQDAAFRKKLEKLVEEIRYSDPVSNEQLVEIEKSLSDEVKMLSALVAENNLLEADKKLTRITGLLADRNRRCKALK